jgi:hypothetical protein
MPLLRLPTGQLQPVRRADARVAGQVARGGTLAWWRCRWHEPRARHADRAQHAPRLPSCQPCRSLVEAGGLDCCRYAAALYSAFGPGFRGYRDRSTKSFLRRYASGLLPPLTGSQGGCPRRARPAWTGLPAPWLPAGMERPPLRPCCQRHAHARHGRPRSPRFPSRCADDQANCFTRLAPLVALYAGVGRRQLLGAVERMIRWVGGWERVPGKGHLQHSHGMPGRRCRRQCCARCPCTALTASLLGKQVLRRCLPHLLPSSCAPCCPNPRPCAAVYDSPPCATWTSAGSRRTMMWRWPTAAPLPW